MSRNRHTEAQMIATLKQVEAGRAGGGCEAGGRVSCHRFRANEARLQLSLLAYNLGKLWRRFVLPKRIRRLVADELAAPAREDWRATDQARQVLLVVAGRGTSAPAVWRDAAADLGSAGTGRVALAVSEKSCA